MIKELGWVWKTKERENVRIVYMLVSTRVGSLSESPHFPPEVHQALPDFSDIMPDELLPLEIFNMPLISH